METTQAIEQTKKATQIAKMRLELAQARAWVANQQLQEAIELWAVAVDKQLMAEKAEKQACHKSG